MLQQFQCHAIWIVVNVNGKRNREGESVRMYRVNIHTNLFIFLHYDFPNVWIYSNAYLKMLYNKSLNESKRFSVIPFAIARNSSEYSVSFLSSFPMCCFGFDKVNTSTFYMCRRIVGLSLFSHFFLLTFFSSFSFFFVSFIDIMCMCTYWWLMA